MISLRHYLLKSTFFTICFLILWWNVTPIIMPLAMSVVSPMLNHSFDQRYGARIETDSDKWILVTTLYLSKPKDGKVKVWYTHIGNLTNYTIALPLLLGFFVAVKKFRYRDLLVAIAILSAVIILMMWAKASLSVWSLLTDDSVEYIKIYSGYYQQVRNYPTEYYYFFATIHNNLIHILFFTLPILLVYWFNRDFYHRLFKSELSNRVGTSHGGGHDEHSFLGNYYPYIQMISIEKTSTQKSKCSALPLGISKKN